MSGQPASPHGVSALRLRTFRSWTAGLSVYVFRAGPWLIDAGPRHARWRLLRWPGLDSVAGCLVTHHDEDHCGNAAALAERGIRVLAMPAVLAELQQVRPIPAYRRWVWGAPDIGPVAPLQGEVEADGWRLVALHTPGHSSDHFVFYEPVRGLVFSGDLYIARRVPVATPREDVDQLLASLRKVRDLRPTAMYCAHRGRVDRPAEALAAKIAWLEEVVDRARELAARGMSVRAIRRRVLGREGLVRWVSGGEYCKRNLIEAALRSRR